MSKVSINSSQRRDWTDLKFHQPTYLYYVGLTADKTSEVESMCGYIARLAFVHSETIATLIHDVIGSKYPRYSKKLEWNHIPVQFINAHFSTSQIIEIMEVATGQDNLSNSTLYNFRHLLGQDRLIRRYHSWCPECYQEMLENQSHVYDKLKWSLEGTFICLVHKRYLSSFCPYCYKRFYALRQNYVVGFCPWCNFWLGSPLKQETLIDEIYMRDAWVTQMIEHLIVAGQQNPERLQLNNVNRAVAAFKERFKPIRELAVLTNLSEQFYQRLSRDKQSVALVSLLKLAWAFDCNVVHLLDGQFELEVRGNGYNFRPKKPLELQFVATKGLKDISQTRRAFEEILKSNRDPWPTIEELTQELGCSLSAIYDNFPSELKRFSERSKAKRLAANEQNRLDKLARIKEVAMALHEAGIRPIFRKIEEIMDISLSHLKPQVREIIDEITNPNEPKSPSGG
jgi:hypothetical protein